MYLSENKLVTSTPSRPFGTALYNRGFSFENYRYGFNGKAKDNEVFGNGNFIDYGKRENDPRLARFFSVDPITKKYPMLTPYQFASNRPIDGVDWDGLEHALYIYTIESGKPKLLQANIYDVDRNGKHGTEILILGNSSKTDKTIYIPSPHDSDPPSKPKLDRFGEALDKLVPKPGNAMRAERYDGEKGLKQYSKDLNSFGTLLKATPFAELGEGLTLASDAIDSGLDFKNKDLKTAVTNTAKRIVFIGFGKVIDAISDKASKGANPTEKLAQKAAKLGVDQALDKTKETVIKP